jgi:hypothetical protein
MVTRTTPTLRPAAEMGAAYARERCAFGIPIGTYQAVAHPLADALVAKDGAQLLAWKASWALETDHPDAPVLARQAFVFAAELASHAAQHSLHIHGGYGFTQECDIQLSYRRSQARATTVGNEPAGGHDGTRRRSWWTLRNPPTSYASGQRPTRASIRPRAIQFASQWTWPKRRELVCASDPQPKRS